MPFLPTILFRPADEGKFHIKPTSSKTQSLINTWTRAFPNSTYNPELDFEDWVEPASLLHAAMLQSPERLAIVAPDNTARYLINGAIAAEGIPALFIGQWQKNDTLTTGLPPRYNLLGAMQSIHSAERYFLLNAFAQYAGRPVITCGVAEYDSDQVERNLWNELAAMSAKGIERAFVKVSRHKYAIFQIDLPPHASASEIRQHVIASDDGLAWASVHLGGNPHAFIVQPYVTMQHEYRIIVIDHKPVTGAGCIEYFTPVHNLGDDWDIRTEVTRSCRKVDETPDVISLYRQFASTVSEAVRKEKPDCSHYTLDVAMINGQPAIIEFNPLQNFGLYAMNCRTLLSALTRAADSKCFDQPTRTQQRREIQ